MVWSTTFAGFFFMVLFSWRACGAQATPIGITFSKSDLRFGISAMAALPNENGRMAGGQDRPMKVRKSSLRIHDWQDNCLRFALLNHVASGIAGEAGGRWRPDIVHAND